MTTEEAVWRKGRVRQWVRTVLWMIGLPLLCAAAVAMTVWPRLFNREEVFTRTAVLFVEADCYARMIRVAEVYRHPGKIIRHHEFENWPEGTSPHTTAPLDYVIAAIVWGFAGRVSLDVAGAVVGPGLAALTALVLAMFWILGRWRSGWAALVVFALSPALVWATVLGRPDHQALLVLLLTVAGLMEFRMLLGENDNDAEAKSSAERPRFAPWFAGAAWGLALWTSLFEPSILFLGFTTAALATGGLRAVRERLGGWAVMGGILSCALLIEGVRVTLPGANPLFANWARLIPELRHASFGESLRWGGWVVFGAPILLLAQATPGWAGCARERARAVGAAGVLLLLVALAFWQQRWSPYAVLLCAIALPWALKVFGRRWPAQVARGVIVAASLWPVGTEWEALLYPTPQRVEMLQERRSEALILRTLSSGLVESPQEEPENRGVLAPYWFGPALSYWSGRPVVGGTSHQSLAGIADTAAFYLEDQEDEVMETLRRRKVSYVLAYDARRIMATSQIILGRKGTALSMGNILEAEPRLAPPGLKLVAQLGPFVLYRVNTLTHSAL